MIDLYSMAIDPPIPPVAALEAAPSRDEIARIVLDYSAGFAPRVAMLVVRGGALLVLDGRGLASAIQEAGRLSLPLTPSSTLSQAVSSGQPFRGPLGDTAIERGWIERVGAAPAEVLLLPIVVREKAIALLYADGWTGALNAGPLHAMAAAAGRAYERLILARKKDGSGPKPRPKTPEPPPRPVSPAVPPPIPSAATTPRADPRYAVALDCLVRHETHTLEGESRDLSRGGLCIRLDQPLPIGARVALQVSLVFGEDSQSEPLPIPATVVWCTRMGASFQVGTRFAELDPETREYVDLFLRFLDAAPPDDDDEEEDADAAPWA